MLQLGPRAPSPLNGPPQFGEFGRISMGMRSGARAAAPVWGWRCFLRGYAAFYAHAAGIQEENQIGRGAAKNKSRRTRAFWPAAIGVFLVYWPVYPRYEAFYKPLNFNASLNIIRLQQKWSGPYRSSKYSTTPA